jgi:2-polyprenyl-6-methoxyphenol hydroxylase-like FAD-dependent oxidoreductase
MTVVIGGAGPGGACLAFLLARAGVSVTLIERHADFSREFRGERVVEAGISSLQTMDLWERVERLDTLRLTKQEIYIDRKLARTIENEEDSGGPLYLPQPPFLESVIEAATQFDEFTFARSTTVTDVLKAKGRIVGVVASRRGEERHINADLVIAADGRHSRLRRLAGLEAISPPGETPLPDVLWVKAPAPKAMKDAQASRGWIGDGTLAWGFLAPDGDVNIGWSVDRSLVDEMKKKGEREWFYQLLNLVDDNMRQHLIHVEDQMKRSHLHVLCHTAQKWWSPGLLMIGDAAHPMSPAAGQGISMAFRDAIVATNLIVPAIRTLSTPKSLDSICEAFQLARIDEVMKIQATQREMSKMLMQRTDEANDAIRGGSLLNSASDSTSTGPRRLSPSGDDLMRFGTPIELDPAVRTK